MIDGPHRKTFTRRAWRRHLLCPCLVFLAGLSDLPAQVTSGLELQQNQRPATNSAQGSATQLAHLGSATVAPEDVSTMKLIPGSMVDVHVFEEPDLDGSYRVDGRGNVNLPVAGAVRLESLTLAEAETAIREKLITAQILKVANVSVNLAEYSAKNITVLGEVNSPGAFPVLGPRKLQDVLALAGGETTLAGNEIVVHRFGSPPDSTETIRYNRNASDYVSLNVAIDPGDSVFVKRAGVVYVLGAVNRPGGYIMQETGELNVDQALALALGTSIEAKVQDIRIFRKIAAGGLVEIPVNYRKINSGRIAPLQLRPEDVVYVPPSSLKTTLIRGTQVISAAASATIYTSF